MYPRTIRGNDAETFPGHCIEFLVHVAPQWNIIWVSGFNVYVDIKRERNVLFNDALNTFYIRLYGVRHMVKDHSDSKKGNPLPPHRPLLSINSKGSFICTIPQWGLCYTSRGSLAGTRNSSMGLTSRKVQVTKA